MSKSNNMEIEERLMYILELKSKGIKTSSELFRYYSGQYPGLTERTFENDLQKVTERLRETFALEASDMMAEIIQDLRLLYNKNLKLQDFKECRAILKTISDIAGWNHEAIMKNQAKKTPEEKKGIMKLIDKKKAI